MSKNDCEDQRACASLPATSDEGGSAGGLMKKACRHTESKGVQGKKKGMWQLELRVDQGIIVS